MPAFVWQAASGGATVDARGSSRRYEMTEQSPTLLSQLREVFGTDHALALLRRPIGTPSETGQEAAFFAPGDIRVCRRAAENVSLDDYFDGILALAVFLAGPTALDRKGGGGAVFATRAGKWRYRVVSFLCKHLH
jgi:hypothetical protein